jgi:hypothetical protein
MDLNASSYQTASGIRSALKGYIDALKNFNGIEHGGLDTTGLIRARELELAIPQAPNATQAVAINDMIAYARSVGVTLRIIVFP